MRRRPDDSAVSAVIGAVVLLAILGMALLYVNAFHVPRQGASLEVGASERGDDALTALAARLGAPPAGLVVQDVPLAFERASPPLMSGIVLSPVRAEGKLALDARPSNLSISVVVDAPATGVPAGDPTRESVAGGRMRVHLLGNATSGQPLGALRLTMGGAHLAPSTRVLEGGAVLSQGEAGGSSVAPHALVATAQEGRTLVSWRVPILAGSASEVSGQGVAQVALVPGPESALGGGGAVHELRIVLDTPRLSAWQDAMNETLGGRATYVRAPGATPDEGRLTVTVLDPRLDLRLVRYTASLAERAS